MKEGAWINAKTGQFAWVDEHARFIQRKTDAEAIGVPERVFEQISTMKWDFNGEGREKILATVMKAGFIRMRGHGNYWTFEFTMKSQDALWACLDFLMNYAGPYTTCRFNNLRTGETIEMPFKTFTEDISKDGPESILRIARIMTDEEYPRKMAFLRAADKFKSPLLSVTAMSGYPRLMQILKGKVPSVHTFGIMSVDNPMGKTAPAEFNNKQQAQFKKDLQRSGLGYVQHKGKYGEFERAFFIMNVRKSAMMTWMKAYNQDSIIFGQVNKDSNSVLFEMIGNNGEIRSTRTIALVLNDGNPEFYSEIKGRKFIIPFFDDEYIPSQEDSNIPVEIPFDGPEIEKNPENLPHLATIYTNSEQTRKDALGLSTGMGAMYTRASVLAAMRKLKP